MSLFLLGCPSPPRRAAPFPQVDPPEAHIRRAEAIKIAQRAFREAGMGYEGLDVDARYVPAQDKDGTKHHYWLVYFVDPKVTGVGASGVHIDDRTGKAQVELGA